MDAFTNAFNEKLTAMGLLTPPKPKTRSCRHGSYYSEGRADNGDEICRCVKCSRVFTYDGVRYTRVK